MRISSNIWSTEDPVRGLNPPGGFSMEGLGAGTGLLAGTGLGPVPTGPLKRRLGLGATGGLCPGWWLPFSNWGLLLPRLWSLGPPGFLCGMLPLGILLVIALLLLLFVGGDFWPLGMGDWRSGFCRDLLRFNNSVSSSIRLSTKTISPFLWVNFFLWFSTTILCCSFTWLRCCRQESMKMKQMLAVCTGIVLN